MRDPIGTNPTGPAQYNNVPGGGNVLYIDAHISGLKYDGQGDVPLNGACGSAVSWADGVLRLLDHGEPRYFRGEATASPFKKILDIRYIPGYSYYT